MKRRKKKGEKTTSFYLPSPQKKAVTTNLSAGCHLKLSYHACITSNLTSLKKKKNQGRFENYAFQGFGKCTLDSNI